MHQLRLTHGRHSNPLSHITLIMGHPPMILGVITKSTLPSKKRRKREKLQEKKSQQQEERKPEERKPEERKPEETKPMTVDLL